MPNLDEKRDILCIPLAKELIKVVAEHIDSIDPLEQKQEPLAEMYKPVFEKFLAMMIEKDVPISNIQYVFGLIQVMFNKSAHYLSLWVNTNQDIADGITYNKESSYDVTIKDLADYLDKNKEDWLKRIQDSKKVMEQEKGSVVSPIQPDQIAD